MLHIVAGRELYRSGFGTAVCSCPDGTIEGADDLDRDVCEPILGKSLQCLPEQLEMLALFPNELFNINCKGMKIKIVITNSENMSKECKL
ncbi:hypothetical protein Avbf_15583 [Armadillidium vulgare]|nr:hypothetical protein Avbf_15583 [Armadillidium vulgare]